MGLLHQSRHARPRRAETIHGSTVAINTAIEEKGAETALVVTKGTRDVYKIGRQNRPDAYNFDFRRPQPLVPRSRTYEVTERLSARGEVLTALDLQELENICPPHPRQRGGSRRRLFSPRIRQPRP